MTRIGREKKNLFFPASLEEEDLLEENEQELPDGYGLFANDWYDLPGGLYYVCFPAREVLGDESW
jgi:hypothetical protein